MRLAGNDFADFDSRGFGDHFRLLLPQAGGRVERGDYTPRRLDRQVHRLSVGLGRPHGIGT
ncbi:hypothetical protein A0U93_09385 [Neoasaia chiangmaiensis]|uniref:Uncharacterized protein n=2 Tax=Neoasaia chiangmaiensis TaxID=320497 RepID=A0A1U9KQU8_9PROT|nr:hypothetical protein A0U93_09385 [Neoasaia chiangmaiensis]